MRPRMIGAILIGVGFLTLGQMLPAAGQYLPPILDCDATHPVTTYDSTGTCTTTDVKNTIGWALSTYTATFGGPSLNVRGTCNEGAGNVYIYERFNSVLLDGRDLRGDGRVQATIVANDACCAAVAIKGRNVTIRGFNVRHGVVDGATDGIQVHRGGTAVIDGVNVQTFSKNGIIVNQFAYAQIVNSVIINNGRDGIYMSEGGVARIGFLYDYEELTTTEPNYIGENFGNGITVKSGSEARIVGNTIQNHNGDGISVSMGAQAWISSNLINNNGGNGIIVSQNSGANLGADEGTSVLAAPNETTVVNGGSGVTCSMGGYMDGRLGTLTGKKANKFAQACINSLK